MSKVSQKPKPRRQNRKGRGQANWVQLNSVNSSLKRNVVVSVPKYLQLFPDEFDCWSKTDVNMNFTTTTAPTYTFKINGPFNLFGPQANFAGAFGVNVPAGSDYLISNQGAAGASAPYSKCVVLDAEIGLEWISVTGALSPGAWSYIIPSLQSSLAASTGSQLREQRGVSVTALPATTAESPMCLPIRQTCRFSISDLFGVDRKEVLENPDFSQQPTVDPVNIGYVHLVCGAVDGVTVVNYFCRATIRLHMRFRRLNNFRSSAPALAASEAAPETRSSGYRFF
jgi:hypothetical protein